MNRLVALASAAATCAALAGCGLGTANQATSSPRPTTTVTVTVTPAEEAPDAAAATPQAPTAPSAPAPAQVVAALQGAGVPLVVVDGWDAEWDLPSRQADWQPIGVMLHHTGTATPGSAPSLDFLTNYTSTMVLTDYDGLAGGQRGANVLIGRDGTVYLIRATRGPHAGIGGPMTLGGDTIPSDNANGYLYGLEIESAGGSADIHSDPAQTDGFSTAQVESTARVSAALLALVGRGTENLTDHKAWAGAKQGKIDLIGSSLETFRARTSEVMSGG